MDSGREAIEKDDLRHWLEVHALLKKSVEVAREAVGVGKARRRYWLEEICANISAEGKLRPDSIWRRPVVKRAVTKRKPASKGKSLKQQQQAQQQNSQPRDEDTETEDESDTVAPVVNKQTKALPPKKKLKLKLSKAKKPGTVAHVEPFPAFGDIEGTQEESPTEGLSGQDSTSYSGEAKDWVGNSGELQQSPDFAQLLPPHDGVQMSSSYDMGHVPAELREFMSPAAGIENQSQNLPCGNQDDDSLGETC